MRNESLWLLYSLEPTWGMFIDQSRFQIEHIYPIDQSNSLTAANSRHFSKASLFIERSNCTCTNKYTEISQNLQPNTDFWWEKTHPHIQNLLDGDVVEID